MQAMAFAPSKLGSLGTSMRTGRAICGVLMQSGSSVQQDSADAGEDDGPKLSRAQRRLQEKYSKKNTDGSAKATQQVSLFGSLTHPGKYSLKCVLVFCHRPQEACE
jgi:hypothetical protein